MGQMSLFSPREIDIISLARSHSEDLSAEFLNWLPENLHIWGGFVAEAIKVKARGRSHYSARTIIEFLRHHSSLEERAPEFKINSNNAPYLARLFDIAYPQHAGLFEYRTTTKEKGNSPQAVA